MSKERQKAENTFVPQNQIDSELQQEIDDALGGMSLDDIVSDDENKAGQAVETGARKGKVIAVNGDDVFVDMGGKSEGVLPASQFEDEPVPAVGDWIEVMISGYNADEGLLELSRKGAVQAAAWESLEEGQIVEGRVTALNTGGLELTVDGIRAFMPISQVELHRIEDLAPYINQKMRCKVMEIRDGSIVVGRRDLLKEAQEELRQETMSTLTEGMRLTGEVKSIMPYGAFVDVGGAEGLLHVSDMSYSRVNDPSSVVKVGQKLDVVVLKADKETGKLSLGLKQIKADPWTDAEHKWVVDSVVSGRVVRLADFGAFVELEEGVDGLIPMGELSFERRVRHASEIVSEGDIVQVRVMSMEVDRKRISLSLKRTGEDPWMGASARWATDSVVEGTVTRLADFGAFIQLAAGVEGMVHISELSSQRVRSVGDVLKEGQEVKAKVLDCDEEKRRISLSIKALEEGYVPEEAPETPAAPPVKRKEPKKGGLSFPGGGMSLGDLTLGQ